MRTAGLLVAHRPVGRNRFIAPIGRAQPAPLDCGKQAAERRNKAIAPYDCANDACLAMLLADFGQYKPRNGAIKLIAPYICANQPRLGHAALRQYRRGAAQ